ncbi:ADP-ribosylation factor-related protein 1 [Hordeum vulgare]|nr:ADP-ribosylation factor-related protein 1 [Hordeum vulgare]
MGIHGRKDKNDYEAGSFSGRRRRGTIPPPLLSPAFHIVPPAAGSRQRSYVSVKVCQSYLDMGTPLPWSGVHLPNNWHLSADYGPIPPIPVSGRA